MKSLCVYQSFQTIPRGDVKLVSVLLLNRPKGKANYEKLSIYFNFYCRRISHLKEKKTENMLSWALTLVTVVILHHTCISSLFLCSLNNHWYEKQHTHTHTKHKRDLKQISLRFFALMREKFGTYVLQIQATLGKIQNIYKS